VCSNVNRLLCRNIAPGKFVTLCYAVIDTAQRTVSYANAGHNPPFLVHADGSVDRLSPTGLVLGVIPDWHYDSGSLPVASGDRLVFFTDGITEALSPAGDEFADERLIELLVTHRWDPPGHLIQRISEAVADWTGGSAQDDATLIAVAVA
jgi:sigma-B regulation protein RsbU (phosphoserine phosphatase)